MARRNGRKPKGKKFAAGQFADRGEYPRILIVCEGAKTEPNYFKAARDKYQLKTANVEKGAILNQTQ